MSWIPKIKIFSSISLQVLEGQINEFLRSKEIYNFHSTRIETNLSEKIRAPNQASFFYVVTVFYLGQDDKIETKD